MLIVWGLAGIAVLAALLVLKLRRDAVTQDGRRVGSALAWVVAPDGVGAYFPILRAEPAFKHVLPFEYGGRTFLMTAYEDLDDRSPVLRRFHGVTCRMLPGR